MTTSKSIKDQIRKGFTLIELLITIAIVAILATVAIPAYTTYTIRGEVTEGLATAASAKLDISAAFLTGGAAGVTAAATAINTASGNGAYNTKYVSTVTVEDDAAEATLGEITVTFGNDANTALQPGGVGDTIIFAPRATQVAGVSTPGTELSTAGAEGSIDWGCASTGGTRSAAFLGGNAQTLGTVDAIYAPSTCK